MKVSIQTKFLIVCILLVLLTTAGLSGTYYVLINRVMHRESRQRIRIAFDIILHDFTGRLNTYAQRIDEFLANDTALPLTTSSYMEDTTQVNIVSFLTNYLKEATDILKRFGHNITVDRLTLYGADKRLLIIYHRNGGQETAGVYLISETGNDTYLPMDDFSQLSPILLGEKPIVDTPLPPGISAFYEGDIPDTVVARVFSEGGKFGIRIIAPIVHREQKTGVLVGDVFCTQDDIERCASLSRTEINLFVADQLSAGTLHVQPPFSQEALNQMSACEDILNQVGDLAILPVTLGAQDYYQGQCAFHNGQNAVGAVIVSLSQDIEKQEVRKIQIAVLIVSGIALGGAFGLSLIFSRKPLHSMQNIMRVIGALAEGDLQKNADVITRDEFGILSMRVNRMISRLRTIVGQVQRSGTQVTSSSMELVATAKQQEVTMTKQMESMARVVESVREISDVATNLVETMQRVAAMSQETTEFANRSQSDLLRMEEAMRQMEEASKTISGKLEAINEKAENITTVVTTINKVSEQTNLLSLNAAIEAEKAGEYGRGFAVVAREIRRLADQTAVATLDIGRMVQEMQSAVSSGIMEMDKFIAEVRHSAEDVGKISMQLTLIIDQVQALSPNFDEVNVAMGHQSKHAQEINKAMMHLSEEMQQTKDSLHETYSAIEQLNDAARDLQEEVLRFKVNERIADC